MFHYSHNAQRIVAWFHNNNRSLTSTTGARGVIKIKGKPKKLQDWQVYQHLTYESQWKTEINKGWDECQKAWMEAHPDEKMKMTRFEYMNTFIKEKYENETTEMKDKVIAHQIMMEVESLLTGPDEQNLQRQE